MLQRADITLLVPDTWQAYYGVNKESKPSEILNILKKHGESVMWIPFLHSESYFNLYFVYKLEFKDYSKWVMNSIFHKLDSINIQTLGVLLRIAAGKLNNIVKKGDCTKEDAFFIHGVLTTNMNQMHYEIHTEELPF